jgi:mRNA-degrading endonuclease RelE of RelBE toxin-antitoxin system
LKVLTAKCVTKTLSKYPEKIQEQIYNHLVLLEDPYLAPGIECLYPSKHIYRIHVGRTYTIIFEIHKESDTVFVLDLLLIGKAHKRYGRYF